MSDQENKKASSPDSMQQARPVLKLIYDVDKEPAEPECKPVRQPSRLVQFLNSYADSIENDVRNILGY